MRHTRDNGTVTPGETPLAVVAFQARRATQVAIALKRGFAD